jgi:hypothetical protein
MRDANRDVVAELKALRLHGMAGAWADLAAQGGGAGVDSSRWLVEHLLQAESTDRAMRSVSYQMSAARFPAHRDLAGFEFEASKVDRALIEQLADLSFTEAAHNAVFIGGPGTGKTARRTCARRWAWPASRAMASGCAFTPRWTWSTRWSARREPVARF